MLRLVLVVGHRGREVGRIVSGARVYRVVVAFLVHLDAETLELLSGVSLHRVGLLEARQGCGTANQKLSPFTQLPRPEVQPEIRHPDDTLVDSMVLN